MAKKKKTAADTAAAAPSPTAMIPGDKHMTISIAVERDGVRVWTATSTTHTATLAPLVQSTTTSSTTYLARSFADMYPALREQFFDTLLQAGKGKFTRGDLDAFCLAVQAQLSRDTEATGRGKLKDSLYLYGRGLGRAEYIPLDLNLRQAVEDGYGLTGKSGAARRRRNTLAAVAYALHTTPIALLDSKGTGSGCFLCTLQRFRMDEGIPETLHLSVNEVFADLAAGYGKLPGGMMRRIATLLDRGHGESADIDRALLRLFARVNKSKPLTISFEKLFTEIGKTAEYKTHPQRAITALQRALERLNTVGVVEGYRRTATTITIALYPARPR